MITDNADTGEHFDPSAFDDLLARHGTAVTWRRRRLCPCLAPDTGQPNIVCPYCRDLPGSIWDDGQSVTLFAPARRRKDLYDDAGHLLEGIVTFTFPTGVTPGHLDWVELLNADCIVNAEVHVKGEVDKLNRSTERLRFPDVIEAEFIDAIVADVLHTYSSGVDFNVGDDASITWTGGPPDGTQYTVRYSARPVYICWSPESRDEGGTKQPTRVIAQRLDFFRKRAVGE